MKKTLIISICLFTSVAFAAEVPLCALPQSDKSGTIDNVKGEPDPGCKDVLTQATKLQNSIIKSHTNDNKYKISLQNTSSLPPHIKIGAVYLQAINMAPNGMMRPRSNSDIHLEMDIHAQDNLKSSGFAPGDWLPNANISYTIQKIGEPNMVPCGFDHTNHKSTTETTCSLMPMVASDGAHYGDNVKLNGPGFYVITFNAASNPDMFGWHTDTDSKILDTAYVDWKFQQSYIFKWTGIGKKGGY